MHGGGGRDSLLRLHDLLSHHAWLATCGGALTNLWGMSLYPLLPVSLHLHITLESPACALHSSLTQTPCRSGAGAGTTSGTGGGGERAGVTIGTVGFQPFLLHSPRGAPPPMLLVHGLG